MAGEANRAPTMRKIASLLTPALLVLALSAARAEVKLPNVLSSHMVLQRGRPIHLWGWATPGERVTATLNGASASAAANDLGQWSLYLPPQRAGGPYSVKVSGTNTITLDDVLIGDVWFASGQSNMQLPLMGFPGSAVVSNADEEIRNATHPDIRLLHIPLKASAYPLRDQDATWTLCTPQTARTFSAAAYFFARDIAQHEHVPVGIIDSSWGGTPGEAWVSMDTLGSDAALMPVFGYWAHLTDNEADFARIDAAQQREDAAAKAANRPAPWHMWRPDDLESWHPSWLYNGMVAPVTPLAIRGVIWYQGATNTNFQRAAMYERIFKALIGDWRMQWREGNFPFLFVQISSFTSAPEEDWAVVREAQRRTLSVANTGMAVTIDIGNPDNVHPADKQDVGHRLALAARALAYGEHIEYSGPIYRQTSIEGDQVRVWFDHASGGLVAKGGPLTGFEVAGADHKFVPATARIEHSSFGDTVLVSSPQVTDPEFVRYGWANAPVVNLYNDAGLPASPFTSEKEIPRPKFR